MNGVPRKRSVFVPLLLNIPALARVIREEMGILATTNIQNVNVRVVLHGTLHKELVFVLSQDCAALGYAKQSCDEKFVKCPFDTSYVYCL